MKSRIEIPNIAASLSRASDARVRVDGCEVPVLDTQVGAVASFAMEGPVEVVIELNRSPSEVTVRPLSRAVPCRVEGQRITLSLERPGNFSVELDGDIRRPLFLFAGPMRERRPQRGDPNVVYLEAGKVHRFEELALASNQTLFFEPGAVLEAPIRATDAENIRILGAGIIDARYRTDRPTDALRFTRCRDVLLQDVHILDSWGWTLHPLGCDGVVVDNVRETCWRANCDGIDIETCRNVRVSDCFLYNTDDCIAVKVSDLDILGNREVAVDDVLVERTVFWNCIGGNAMEIGFELSGSIVQGVTFRDCDIIRVERGACLSIHAGDTATIRDILFEDIRVEDARDELIDFYIGLSIYSKDCPDIYHRRHGFNVPPELQDSESNDNAGQWVVLPEPDYSRHAAQRGHIEDVVVRHLSVVGPAIPPSLMKGYDEAHAVRAVRFEGLTLGGRAVTDAETARFRLRHAHDVVFVHKEGRSASATGRPMAEVGPPSATPSLHGRAHQSCAISASPFA